MAGEFGAHENVWMRKNGTEADVYCLVSNCKGQVYTLHVYKRVGSLILRRARTDFTRDVHKSPGERRMIATSEHRMEVVALKDSH